jgi:hypothetical protein
MRTQLLGGLTLLLAGLALPCVPGAARAQSGPAPAPGAYPQATSPGNPAVPAGYLGRGGNGYGYNPYYYYTNAPAGAGGYPQGSSGFAAQPEGPAVFQPVLPVIPVTPDELPGDDAHGDKARAPAPATRDCFWVFGGYDMAWIRPWHLTTPLVTQGSATDTHPGALGQPGTTILFPDHADFGRFNGIRLGIGFYLDDADHWSLEWDGNYMIPNHVKLGVSSDAAGNPIIARPIFNVIDGLDRAFLDSAPGAAAGSAFVDARSEFLGSELNLAYHCCPSDHLRLGALAGFRFLRLREDLTIRDSLQPLGSGFTFVGNPVAAGDILEDVDSFRTVNRFYGLQLGGNAGWEGKRFFVNAYGKAALGVTDEEAHINGASALLTGGGPFVAGGGILALPSNIGVYARPVLGFVPEGGLTVGVKVTPHLKLTVGYSFLFWNSVLRPGNQIDRGVNSNLVPTDALFGTLAGPPRPAFHFSDENFWVQTLTFGLDLHF